MRFFRKKTRGELIENKANHILDSISCDINNFTHREEANILLMVLKRFKALKREKRVQLLKEREAIKEAINILK